MDAKRIVVVDDEPDVLEVIAARLTANGYQVTTASDDQEALERIRHEPPDLIVLDVMLPRLNGHEICVILKQDRPYQHIPIVMLTAQAHQDDERLAKESGADAYLHKPYDAPLLLETIHTLLAVPRWPAAQS